MLPADSPFASLPAPGPHPATAELRAYAAGTLNPADEHRIEAHALDCERCAELLEGFSMSDVATTDQALASLRARLQTRVADDLAEPVLLPASRPLWPRLAAGVALLGAVGAGLWGWEHQQPATSVATTTPRPTAAPIAAAPAPATAAAPATEPPATAPATASLPQAATETPAAASARPADYAAVRARRRTARGRIVPLPASAADAEYDVKSAADNASAIQTAPVATEASVLANRAVSPASAGEPATSIAAEEPAAAPSAVVAAAPRPAAHPRKAATDSVAATAGTAASNSFNKNMAFESNALVRDKPMPAAIAIAPAPMAGTPAFREYLRREAAEFELEDGAKPMNGIVRLRFVVEADGKLSNLRVVRGMRADYDDEALRMICEGPAWRPGIAGGRRAALPMEVTVSF
ncbi:energy transducer TonB [Hymenobacter sp. DH14]|uniref:Energy transducer TonB n=1 Tax=Hymenobacter cyanobacteriorum TaxID=2926463 RepID=A0A9X1VGI7_9BACT|nr:energy transducer TonB [Hymenobacter cyanobacteriorum]MCI1188337.1 energy transducer TonB [Hymenobacter cyanobacteriorum]